MNRNLTKYICVVILYEKHFTLYTLMNTPSPNSSSTSVKAMRVQNLGHVFSLRREKQNNETQNILQRGIESGDYLLSSLIGLTR